MTIGVVVLLAALAVASVLGLLKRRYDGRFRATSTGSVVADDRRPDSTPSSSDAGPPGTATTPADPALSSTTTAGASSGPLTTDDLGGRLGTRATLVQFSSAFCAPCRATRQVLRDVAAKEAGVAYVEIDAESHLDLVRRLDVRRTPTVMVLDRDGQVMTRASGRPRRPDVLAALQLVDAT